MHSPKPPFGTIAIAPGWMSVRCGELLIILASCTQGAGELENRAGLRPYDIYLGGHRRCSGPVASEPRDVGCSDLQHSVMS